MKRPFLECLDGDIKTILLAQIRNLWTHTSTAIEGNTLTLGDTAFILEEGLTVAGKPLRDHQQVYGHARGIEVIYQLLEKDVVTEQNLFNLHRVILAEEVIDIFKPAGAWKNESNYTSFIGEDGRQHWREFPAPKHIPHLMAQWLGKLNQAASQSLSANEAAAGYADLHLDFVTVHPFFDGNGRMARLLANLPVLRSGFPPIVVPVEARQEYKRAISDYQQTIPHLEALHDLAALPRNPERAHFQDLCAGYWEPTRTLVEEAHAIQARRNAERQTEELDPGDDFGL